MLTPLRFEIGNRTECAAGGSRYSLAAQDTRLYLVHPMA
jgi:hypothetical protein